MVDITVMIEIVLLTLMTQNVIMIKSIYILGVLAVIGILTSASDTFNKKQWITAILFSLLSWLGIIILLIISYIKK